MSEPQDKLLGVKISGNTTTRVYSTHRIDIDSTKDSLETITGKTTDEYSDNVKFVGSTAIDRGYHSVKSGYHRKVLVSSATARDEVQVELDNAGVSDTTENVTPTADEKDAIEAWGATKDTEVPDVMCWKRAVEDVEAGNITQKDIRLGRNPYRSENVPQPKGSDGTGP